MKKVLHIVESFGSGVFTFLVDLVNETANDYEIVIAYGKREETLENFRDYFPREVKFIEVKNFTRSINLKKDIKALQEVKNIIKNENPNVIHMHSSKAGIIGRLACRNKTIRMLYNPHGFSFLKSDDSKIKRAIYRMIEKTTAIFNHRCTIVGCSEGEYLEAKKLNKNSVCINNGLNIKEIKEETEKLKTKEIDYNNIKICTIGRIGFQKNPKLFNQIAEKFPKNQFTWIGEGELKTELKSSNINVTGWKERKEVLHILNESDIFILTSLWEGLPLSLLEAMYMHKICIVTNVIGNRDVIKDGVNGFIANDCDEFVEKIEYICKNKANNKKVQENALKCINEVFNLNTMVKKYIDEYEEIQ